MEIETNLLQHFRCPENEFFYQLGIYEPLEVDPQHTRIRLLEFIQPRHGQKDGPLEFKLHQSIPLSLCVKPFSSPDKAYPFVAISYRAGEPNDTTVVKVNRRPFNVFRSLWLALGRLLDSLGSSEDDADNSQTLYIWADQICIDQSNADEKVI